MNCIFLDNGNWNAKDFAIRLGGIQYTLADAIWSCRYANIVCGRAIEPDYGEYVGSDYYRFFHRDDTQKNYPVLDIPSSEVYLMFGYGGGGYLRRGIAEFVFTSIGPEGQVADRDTIRIEDVLTYVPASYEGGLFVDGLNLQPHTRTIEGNWGGTLQYSYHEFARINMDGVCVNQTAMRAFRPYGPAYVDADVRLVALTAISPGSLYWRF